MEDYGLAEIGYQRLKNIKIGAVNLNQRVLVALISLDWPQSPEDLKELVEEFHRLYREFTDLYRYMNAQDASFVQQNLFNARSHLFPETDLYRGIHLQQKMDQKYFD